MSTPQLYSVLVAVVGGTLLAEEQEIDFSRSANAQQIATAMRGFTGMSPGASLITIDVQNAVPEGGFEFDAGSYIASLQVVKVQLVGPGGNVIRGDAFITRDHGNYGTKTGWHTRYDFQMVMAIKQFK